MSYGPMLSARPDFERALQFVLRWEGGLSDDPHDPGGATLWGISLATLKRLGLDLTGDGKVDKEDVLALTPDKRDQIYFDNYWKAAGCPRLPPALAVLQFDTAVNQGVGRAIRILQKTVGARVDGVFGPRTGAAIRECWKRGPTSALRDYCANRAMAYSALRALLPRYGRGWFRRLFDAHHMALYVLRVRGGIDTPSPIG